MGQGKQERQHLEELGKLLHILLTVELNVFCHCNYLKNP